MADSLGILDERKTLSVETVAKMLSISRPLAYRLCAERKMPGLIILGRRYVISKAAIEKILSEGWQPEA